MKVLGFIERHQADVIQRILPHCGLCKDALPRPPPKPVKGVPKNARMLVRNKTGEKSNCLSVVRADVAGGFLLDGFPRSVPQARALDALLQVTGRSLDVIVNIAIDDEEIRTRLSRRAGIEGRADDADPTVIQNCIETYKQQSEPCLDYSARRGWFVTSMVLAL